MIGLLVHTPTLEMLLSQPWSELKRSMESGALRQHRPAQDKLLTTTFAIDAEADLLDWMDEHSVDSKDATHAVLKEMEDGAEGLLYLMQWASPGQWEVWEGRAFLYLEAALGREADDIHELYTEEVWTSTLQGLDGLSADEFAERASWVGWTVAKNSVRPWTRPKTRRSSPLLRLTRGLPKLWFTSSTA